MPEFYSCTQESDQRWTTPKVGIVGLGYVGLPLALAFAGRGAVVLGFDVDPEKVEKLNAGTSYIHHLSSERIQVGRNQGFQATSDFARLTEVDAIILCVPTPLGNHREPDLSYVESTAAAVSERLRRGQLVVLESTTYPGTTREVVVPILERSGLRAGSDFWVAYSPEREDPSNPDFNTRNIPKVVGGLTTECGKVAAALYGRVVERVVLVDSCEIAEASKILENTFRAVNIALVNELKTVFHRMGINIWDVIDAASTKPFGFMRFNPGPGLGGHCIPIDPFYLAWKAREFDVATRFIEVAGEVNTQMPSWVAQRAVEALSERGMTVFGARILMIGLAYKKNVDDDRESPSYKLMRILSGLGARVDYHDPYIPSIRKTRHYSEFAGVVSVGLGSIESYDAVIVATDHDCIAWEQIRARARLIIDTRGVYRESGANIVSA